MVGGNCPWVNFPRRNCPGAIIRGGTSIQEAIIRGVGGGAIFLEGNCPITDFKEQRPGADILLPTFVPCGN